MLDGEIFKDGTIQLQHGAEFDKSDQSDFNQVSLSNLELLGCLKAIV